MMCYNQGEPGRVASADTGSNHLLPLEGKQMADCSNSPHHVTRHWPLQAKLDYYSMPEPNSGCLLWLGSSYVNGYGVLNWGNRLQGAHRLAWQVANGPIPKGLHVLHKCDVPACINPAHLFVGTVVDNMTDCVAKGRHDPMRGERSGCAKLTEKQVIAIRADPRSCRIVGLEYGISASQVGGIRRRDRWAHVA